MRALAATGLRISSSVGVSPKASLERATVSTKAVSPKMSPAPSRARVNFP